MVRHGTERRGSGSIKKHQMRTRKACQRCRLRKQKCDMQEPSCKNCLTSGNDCTPGSVGDVEVYEVSYVKSLEQRVSDLETRLKAQPEGPMNIVTSFPVDGSQRFAHSLVNDLQPMDPMHWQYSFYSSITNPPEPNNAFDDLLIDPNALRSLSNTVSANSGTAPKIPISTQDHEFFALEPVIESPQKNDDPLPGFPIPQADTARFLHAYFEMIHPRYPFLDVDECATAYINYKQASTVADEVQASWYSFLLTILCAIGCTISQPSNVAYLSKQNEMLLTRVQAERGVISNEHASPLTHLKAMLLHVILALHGENTSRLVHLTGVTMRFATLHGFHRLSSSNANDVTNAQTKAWSCIYALDRMISGTLRIPLCIADSFITSPLYLTCSPYICSMPWLSDYPGHESVESVDQVLVEKTFTHVLRVRTIQSKIMCTAPTLNPDEISPFIAKMDDEISDWSENTQIFMHIDPENVGYLSSFWLQYMACVVRVTLHSIFGDMDYEIPRAGQLLKACCDACTAFRTVQKGRQLVRSWIDMVFDFQAGVTILYLKWKGVELHHQDVDRAIRNCTSTLAILAEGAPNVEVFRDCFDALATFVGGNHVDQEFPSDVSEDLNIYCRKVIALGVAPHIAGILREMSDLSPD